MVEGRRRAVDERGAIVIGDIGLIVAAAVIWRVWFADMSTAKRLPADIIVTAWTAFFALDIVLVSFG